MFNSKLIKEAHKLTKEIKAEFAEVNYKFQFGLCISYLLEGEKMEEVKMVEITQGSPKQIAWATEIRNDNIKMLEREISELNLRNCGDTEEFKNTVLKPLIEKFEKAILETKTLQKDAKFWIEHKNLAGAYIQKCKRK